MESQPNSMVYGKKKMKRKHAMMMANPMAKVKKRAAVAASAAKGD